MRVMREALSLNSSWMLLSQDRALSLFYKWKNTQQQSEKLFLENFYFKTQKLILNSNSRLNTNLASVRGPFTQVKSAWAHDKNYSTQTSSSGRSQKV